MLTGLLIIAVVGLLGVLSHRRSRLEHKIYKNVPLEDWLVVFILPVSLYLGWFFVVKNILLRPPVSLLPFDDVDILALTILFMVYGFVGNAIHFTGKILWRHLQGKNHTMAYKINEMFHGKLSHYLVFLNGLFILFMLPILEINHPNIYPLSSFYLYLLVLAGIIFGISTCKGVFYTNEWFGGYNRPLFYITSFLLIMQLGIVKTFSLKFSLYPVNLFILTMFVSEFCTYILRQLFIFARLGNRRRLRFLAKILSA